MNSLQIVYLFSIKYKLINKNNIKRNWRSGFKQGNLNIIFEKIKHFDDENYNRIIKLKIIMLFNIKETLLNKII